MISDQDFDGDEDGRFAVRGAPEHLRGGGPGAHMRLVGDEGAGVEERAGDGVGGVFAETGAGLAGVDQGGRGGGWGGEGGEDVGGEGEHRGEKGGQHGGGGF